MTSKFNNSKFRNFIFRYITLALVIVHLLKEGISLARASLILLTIAIGFIDYLSDITQNIKKQIPLKILVSFGLFFLIYIGSPFAIVYLYIFTSSILRIYPNKIKYIIFVFLLTAFIVVIFLKVIPYRENFSHILTTLYSYIFPYLVINIIGIASYARKTTRIAISKLNEELTIQNKKLQEYSSQIEELTLSNERNRVAQDLHDSLGHYLMAISMHLDLLEKVKTSPEKSEQILTKTKVIVKDSIKELRNTVFELKEMKNSTILSASIYELAQTTAPSSEVLFNINIDNEIENFSPFIKSIIYKTVQESITNGIKHGKATCFDINLSVSLENINFSIRNFGIPADDIIKSNGLKGITQRVELAKGKAFFICLKDGFLVKATIPVRKEDKID